MSFLHNAPVLQRTGDHRAKEDGKTVTTSSSKQRSQRALSNVGLLSPLVRLVQDPLGLATYITGGLHDGSAERDAEEMAKIANRKRICLHRLKNAITYDQWHALASELDFLEGNEAWKSDSNTTDFDTSLVEARLKQMDDARLSCDVERMLFLIRTSLSRGLGDMDHVRLYQHSYTGTKYLIERYISSALDTLDTMLDVSAKKGDEGLDPKYILDQVLSARQAFGRSALLLSGGATFGMSHIGVLKTLWEARLLPRIISGASAGSIVCSVLCTRTDEELPEILENFCDGDLAVFEKTGDEDGPLRRLGRFLKIGALIDISHLTRVMRELLGDMTFQEGYNRTRRILNICVSSASLYELPRLLNYITAPNVIIWSAVAASCSVPFLFTPASLLAKDPKTGEAIPWNPTPQRYIDGSVDNDLPMTRLAEMFNVNHFIVSQVNPHVVPFLLKDDQILPHSSTPTPPPPAGSSVSYLHTFASLAKNEALHRLHLLAELGILPNAVTKLRSVLSQKYSGDITILPEINYAHVPRALKNPTPEFMLQSMLCGERATWPKISRVRNHCAIELALDRAVQKLRARVVFSPASKIRELKLSASLEGLGNGNVNGNGSAVADGSNGHAKHHHHANNISSKKRRHHDHPKPLRPNIPNGHSSNGSIMSSSLPSASSYLPIHTANAHITSSLDMHHNHKNSHNSHHNRLTAIRPLKPSSISVHPTHTSSAKPRSTSTSKSKSKSKPHNSHLLNESERDTTRTNSDGALHIPRLSKSASHLPLSFSVPLSSPLAIPNSHSLWTARHEAEHELERRQGPEHGHGHGHGQAQAQAQGQMRMHPTPPPTPPSPSPAPATTITTPANLTAAASPFFDDTAEVAVDEDAIDDDDDDDRDGEQDTRSDDEGHGMRVTNHDDRFSDENNDDDEELNAEDLPLY